MFEIFCQTMKNQIQLFLKEKTKRLPNGTSLCGISQNPGGPGGP